MSEESAVIPLTPEEEAQLAELQYRQAMTDWQVNEDARLAALAAVQPVVDALAALGDISQFTAELNAARDPLSDEDRRRVDRIVQIVSFDAGALIAKAASLSQPQPQPVDPTAEPAA